MRDRLGVRGRLLMAFFGISAFAVLAAAARLPMSACGYKQTCGEVRQSVRFTPESRHPSRDVRFLAKYVRFTSRSRPSWWCRRMTAYG